MLRNLFIPYTGVDVWVTYVNGMSNPSRPGHYTASVLTVDTRDSVRDDENGMAVRRSCTSLGRKVRTLANWW